MLKLAVGTVQFGLNYGISNKEGKTPFEEVVKIMKYAESVGIEILDTAAAYGESEKVIGEATKNHKKFKIITKIPPFQSDKISDKEVQQLETIIQNSLNKLKRDKVYGIMFHNVNDLFKKNGERLYYKLIELKSMNLVEKIGFSVYDGEEIDRLCELFSFDIIQLPINVLDQRLLKSGHLAKLKEVGVEVYARSIFLQGLLLMDLENVPKYFETIIPLLREYHEMLHKNDMTLLDGAIDFVKSISEIDYFVVGVNNLEQLIEIKRSYEYGKSGKFDYSRFACTNDKYIDPRRWKK